MTAFTGDRTDYFSTTRIYRFFPLNLAPTEIPLAPGTPPAPKPRSRKAALVAGTASGDTESIDEAEAVEHPRLC